MDRRSLVFLAALAVAFFFVTQWFGAKKEPNLISPSIQNTLFSAEDDSSSSQEEFYVLENAYQQLVFSTKGGALAEINLPLQGKEHPTSPIQKIQFDRVLEKEYPESDRFPASSYYVISETGAKTLKEKGPVGGYYPLLRRSPTKSSRFYACNLLTPDALQDPETNIPLFYEVTRFEKGLLEFTATLPERQITKTFTLPSTPEKSPYCFDLEVKVEGKKRGLLLTSGVPEVELVSGNPAPAIKYRIKQGQKSSVELFSLPKTSSAFTSISPDWVSTSNGFFGMLIEPIDQASKGFLAYQVPGVQAPTRLTLIHPEDSLYPPEKYPGYELHFPLKSGKTHFRIFAGPLEEGILKTVDAALQDPMTRASSQYLSTLNFHGWFSFISGPFAQFLFILMKGFYWLAHSWGISIILLTVALRIMLYPLNAWSINAASRMQAIAPQIAAIQARHKEDPKKAQIEIMLLYREKKVNPLTGCLPLLIQLPFLIGMFDLLKSTFALRGASFIPGWIDNLTAPDVLFSWKYPLPFIGTEFHLLPILLGVAMFWQQKVSSPASKQTAMTDQQRQQKAMGNLMVVLFTVMFYHFPSGLNLYWLSSMLLGILQQWFMTRKIRSQQQVTILD